MKKSSIVLVAIFAMAFISCSIPARLMNTASYAEGNAYQPVSAVFADLVVSPTKIKFLYIPKSTILNGGKDNVINTAVREALLANGNADVLVSLETQISYDTKGKVQSIAVTGYPATYKNFRSPNDEQLTELLKKDLKPGKKSSGGGLMSSLKLGK